MPKVAINYLNTVIYKIVCNDLNIIDCYVGSTTDFTNRKRHHKDNSTYEIKNKSHHKIYQMIKNHGGWENWNMLQIEEYPCNSSQEARLRERHWYEILNSTLNANNPCRTITQYYQDNKDDILLRVKKYRMDNIELIREYDKKRYAECNKEKRAEKSKQHYQDNIEKYKLSAKLSKEKNKSKTSMIVECICGNKFTLQNQPRHERTKIHLNYVNSQS